MMAGMVMPRDDRTRNRVTGGIFLISAIISAILVASQASKGTRRRSAWRLGELHVMRDINHSRFGVGYCVWMWICPWDAPFPYSMPTYHCDEQAI
jgi:hypothetical protein